MTEVIMALHDKFYREVVNDYHQNVGRGLGPSDEYISFFCMGGEL